MSYPKQSSVFNIVQPSYYPVPPTVGMVGMMVPSTAVAPTSISSLTHAGLSNPAIISRPPTTVNRQPQIIKDASDKPPVTTVFVGNITEKAPDVMIKQLLQRCGNVLSWKRVQGASGKLQAFGFCEYEDPEATLRCIRLLNDWKIGEKNLVVKVDPKTRELLDEYKRKKRDAKSADTSLTSDGDTTVSADSPIKKAFSTTTTGGGGDNTEVEDIVDEITLRDDETVRLGLQSILREYASDLKKGMDGDDR